MKYVSLLLACVLLLLGSTAQAIEVAGVNLAPEVRVGDQTLQLNGYGIRTKFFFKIYVGSLYTSQKVTTTEGALAAPGPKLIRMDFLYGKVEKQKIVDAFADGLVKNSPQVAAGPAARDFLGWFTSDFVRGDQVDLEIKPDGTVLARKNGKILGMLSDPDLGNAVLLIYLGKDPADRDLKEGMLGQD